jgi:hypothetical protein
MVHDLRSERNRDRAVVRCLLTVEIFQLVSVLSKNELPRSSVVPSSWVKLELKCPQDIKRELTISRESCGAFSSVYELASFATSPAFSIGIPFEIWSNMRKLLVIMKKNDIYVDSSVVDSLNQLGL